MLKTLTILSATAALAATAAPPAVFAAQDTAHQTTTQTTAPRHGRVVRHRAAYNNCKSSAHKGTAGGAILGALAGQALGHNTTSTVVGAGVGAVAGHNIRYNNCKRRNR